MAHRFVLFLLSLSIAAPAAAVDLVRGPYLQQVGTDAAIVAFDLDGEYEAEVRVGASKGEYDRTFASAATAVHHEVPLSALDPDTTYSYGVFVGEVELTADLQLKSAIDADTDYTFIVFGDTRSGHDEHGDVIGVMSDDDARFLVHTGDLVASGSDTALWDTFFSIERPLLERMAIYPVIGNHDEDSGEAVEYQDVFALPGNELYYSFDVGNAHFVMLDQYVSTVLACAVDGLLVDSCLDEEQVAWLEADLASAATDADIDLIFVVAHSGPYSSKSGRRGSKHLRVLLPLFAAHGVTAIFSGHDHYYERGITDNGIPYVISGGGGAGLYEISEPSDDPHTVIYNAMVNHFVVVEVSGTIVRFAAKTLDGVIMDELVFDATDLIPPGDDDDPLEAPSQGVPPSEAPDCMCRTASGSTAPIAPLCLGAALLAVSRRKANASPR